MDLVRDLLDRQVVDRNGRPIGRIDKIILELRDDGVAGVTAIEIGLSSVADRLHPFAGRCARALETLLGIERGRPVRMPFSKILNIDDHHVTLDLAATDTEVLAFEQQLHSIVSSIPGAR